MKSIPTIVFLSLLGIASPALASTVSFSSRPTVLGLTFDTAEEYRDNWAALVDLFPSAPSGYGDALIQTWDATNPVEVDNHGLVAGGTGERIAFRYTVDFCIDDTLAGVPVAFRIAPDFGWGGAVFLDGAPVAFNNGDMWWGGDWSNTTQIFQFGSVLGAGTHTIDVYGQEPCCDGPTSGQYAFDGGDWESFGADDNLKCAVCVCPEGGVNAALIGGVFGLLAAGRRFGRRNAR